MIKVLYENNKETDDFVDGTTNIDAVYKGQGNIITLPLKALILQGRNSQLGLG